MLKSINGFATSKTFKVTFSLKTFKVQEKILLVFLKVQFIVILNQNFCSQLTQ